MKKMFCALAATAAVFAGAAEYKSAGFSADVGANGYINKLFYKGTQVTSYVQLNVYYNATAGGSKAHDARFFQSMDWTAKAKVEQKDTTTVYTTDSKLSNTAHKDGILYKQVLTLTPEKITVKYTVKLNFDLYSNADFCRTLIGLPATIQGKQISAPQADGKMKTVTVPVGKDKKAASAYGISGNPMQLKMADNVTISIKGIGTNIFLQDARRWDGEGQYFEVQVPQKWSNTPVKFAKDTEYTWTVEISAVK